MQLQTKDKMFRAVYFSAEKHNQFKVRWEASSPVKLTKFRLKCNSWSSEDEIHLNKRSKVEEPKDEETTFDFKVADSVNEDTFPLTPIETILTKNISTKISVTGRVTFQGTEETVMTKGKTLKKQEAVITDNSSSIRLVLWENDVKNFQSGSSYRLANVLVKTYQEKKYITLNKGLLVITSDEVIEREDSLGEINHENVQCPAVAIKSVQSFKSCKRNVEQK